ncbi:MAG: zinc-ribbon domain-containing protein [Nitrosopumilus sp.]|nr:zinc-ribbon domain-containing protein [Nitrosopumilus sp.]
MDRISKKVCQNCGTTNEQGANFCNHCGVSTK